MLQLTAKNKILLSVVHADFRKGIDGLAAICRQQLLADPFEGSIFVFRNRSGSAIKILTYDGQGFWLCHKRFSKGKLRWWPKTSDSAYALNATQLQILLYNGDPESANIAPQWRKLEI